MEKKIKIGLICLLIITIVLSGCINKKVETNISTEQHEERERDTSAATFVDYLQLAKETGNYSYCDKLANENDCNPAALGWKEHCLNACLAQIEKCKVDFTPKEKCYLTLIKQYPMVEVCERIPQGKYSMGSGGPKKTLRDQCFYVVGIETNNSSLCNEIENSYPKTTCLYYFNISDEN